MSRGFTYANANPAEPCDMLSGVPLLRPAHRVFGYSAQQKAEWALAIAVRDHTASERQYVVACAELGRANRCGQVYGRLAQRPAAKAAAFRMINRARAQRRAAPRSRLWPSRRQPCWPSPPPRRSRPCAPPFS